MQEKRMRRSGKSRERLSITAKAMSLEGAGTMSGLKKEAEMKLWEHDAPGLSQTSASVVSGEDRRQSVCERSAGLTIRVGGIDCLLADVHAQIENLRRERTYLRLVRAELAGGEAKRRIA